MCDYQILETFGDRMRDALAAQLLVHADAEEFGKEWVRLVKLEADIAAMFGLTLAEHDEMNSRWILISL